MNVYPTLGIRFSVHLQSDVHVIVLERHVRIAAKVSQSLPIYRLFPETL